MSTLTQEPPGPPGSRILGLIPQVRRDRLGLMSALAAEFGDAVRFRMGHRELYFFNNPAYARCVLFDQADKYRKGVGLIQAKRVLGDGLLTSEGDSWVRQRGVVQPPLSRQRIYRSMTDIADLARGLADDWSARPGRHDVLADLIQFSIRVLEAVILKARLPHRDLLSGAFEVVQDQAMFEMSTLGLVPRWTSVRRQRRYRGAIRLLDEVVAGLVEQWSGTLRDSDDLISRIVADHASTPRDPKLREQLTTILLSGHDTTASAMSWTLYELARHPEHMSRIRAEADLCLAEGREVTDRDVAALEYTTCVVKEALRLHPPIWLIPRRAITAHYVGDYRVQSGADVVICPYTLHRSPDLWEHPERFRPERFGSDSRHPRYAFLPFGAGPRVCIGSHLAMLEAVLTTAIVVQALNLEPADDREVTAAPMLTLKPAGGMPMILMPR